MNNDWSDFYTSAIDKNVSYCLCNKTSVSNQNYYFSFCKFLNLNNGVIIYGPSIPNVYTLVEDTFFKNNSYSDEGSCFSQLSNNGQVVHNRICCIYCNSPKWGQYCMHYVTQNKESKNYIYSSTISLTGNLYGHHSVTLHNGQQRIFELNVSKCFTNDHTPFCVASNNEPSIVNFSNFAENNSTSVSHCSAEACSFPTKIINCNFISNGICNSICRVLSSEINIESSCFLDNIATTAFVVYDSGSIKVSKSYIYPETSLPAGVTTDNMLPYESVVDISLYKKHCDISYSFEETEYYVKDFMKDYHWCNCFVMMATVLD